LHNIRKRIAHAAYCAHCPFKASAQDVSIDQILQMMENSDENLATYTYTRTAESRIFFSNESLHEEFDAAKTTEGKVNMVDQEGWWDASSQTERTERLSPGKAFS